MPVGNFLKNLALITQLGLSIITPIAGGAFIGGYIQRKFDIGSSVTIILIVFGLIGGLFNAYRLIMKSID